MNILWADDQESVSKSLSNTLAGLGHELTYVPDAESALVVLSKGRVDLLILDLKMPPGVWGGLWLLEQMQSHSDVPVIVLSGEGTQIETIKALRLGAQDYVMKEQASVELRGRVSAALELNNIRRSLNSLIESGESNCLEFKETLRWNLRENKPDRRIEHASFKTVAAFLNSHGGTLLIGVNDGGETAGIERDGFENQDKFCLHFDNLVKTFLLDNIAHHYIRGTCHKVGEKTIFRVDCKASASPVFLAPTSGDEREFWIRRTASSVKLRLDEAVRYIQDHFPGPTRSRER